MLYPPNYYSFATPNRNLVFRLKEWLDKRLFKKILQRIDGNTIKVLDVGGGTGWLSSLLKKTDGRIGVTQIVDIDGNAGAAAEKAGHRYFKGRLEDFETTEKYDLILMLNLIEHVQDPLAILKKASALLSEKGVVLIKTPNTQSLDARLFRNTYWGGLHCPRHWIIFSEKSVRLLVEKTSLRILSLRYTQGGPFWAFSIIAALHRKKLIRVSKQRPVIYHPLFAPVSAVAALFDFGRRIFFPTSQMFIVLKHMNNKTV